jgi:hypothetical protein
MPESIIYASTICATASHRSLLAAVHPLPLIGQLLGHSNPSTTSRYTHLFDGPQRTAVERVSATIAAAGRAERAHFVSLRGSLQQQTAFRRTMTRMGNCACCSIRPTSASIF